MNIESKHIIITLGLLVSASAQGQVTAPTEPAPVEEAEVEEAEVEEAEIDEATVEEAEAEEVVEVAPEEGDSEEVVVTGNRIETRESDATVATEVISRRHIEGTGATHAADLLESHPGVNLVYSFRGTGIQLQGLDPKHVLILVDGERLVGQVDGTVDLRRFNAEDLERIEIVKGPGSALYGSDALGGVVNLITRRGTREMDANADAIVGDWGRRDLSGNVGMRGERWRLRLSGGWHQADGFDLDPSDVATDGRDVEGWNVSQRASVKVTSDLELRLRGSYTLQDWAGVDTNEGGAVFDRLNRTESFSVSGGPTLLLGEGQLKVDAHFTMVRDQFALDQRGAADLDVVEDNKERLTQITAQYNRLIAKRHLVVVGLVGALEALESPRLVSGTQDRQRGAVFFQDEWTLSQAPNLVLVPGARLDFNSQFGTYPSPKLAVRYDPVESVVIRASYGLGFRAPAFKEQFLNFENTSAGYVIAGNPDLKPETSRAANFSAEYRLGRRTSFALSGYRNDVRDLINIDTLSASTVGQTQRFAYGNIGRAYTQGAEARVRAGVEALSVDLSYTLTDSRDEDEDRALQGRALHSGTVDLRGALPSWGSELTARARLVGRRPFYSDEDGDGVDETDYAEPYAQVDLRFGQSIGDKLRLSAGVENLADAGETAYLAVRPRSYYVGVSGRL